MQEMIKWEEESRKKTTMFLYHEMVCLKRSFFQRNQLVSPLFDEI